MNDKLPKPMLDALARQTKPAEHPSADVLSAFAEQGLRAREKELVDQHLAGCAECREVVFLANGAAEEAFAQSGEFLAAAQPGQLSAVRGSAGMSRAAVGRPRKRWALRWVWAASGAAAVVLVGGLFVAPHFTARPAQEVAMKGAPANPSSEKPQELDAIASMAASPQANTAKARPAERRPIAPKVEKTSPGTSVVVASSDQAPAPQPNKENGAAASSARPAESATISIGGAMPGAIVSSPRASGFAPNAGQAQQQLDSLNVTVNRTMAGYARAQQSNWRISAQGQLERRTADGWTRMLADQPSAFHVVSVIAGNVWAGGNDGMLFHSADNGLHWNKVAIMSAGANETGAIVSIRFSDPQHGEVVTDGGASYITSDSGGTWTKQ